MQAKEIEDLKCILYGGMAIEVLLKVATLHVFSNAMNCQVFQWGALSNHGQSEIFIV